jgi:hypothetical protein
MRATLSQTEYYRVYGRSAQSQDWTGTLKKAQGRLMAFSPLLWILFFALLTGIVKLLAK